VLDKLFNKRVPDSETEIITEALSSDSRILFFDDPLCRFGAEQKEAEFGRIRVAARETDKYIVYATANYDDVLRLCDNVAVIGNGEVLQTGTPEGVYLHPATATVAALTGQCNIFEARRLSSSKADVPEFQTITGGHRLISGKTDKARLGALNRNITLAVRPEHISISFGASFPEDNLLKAVVTGAEFLGPSTVVELDASGLKVKALVMRLVGLKPGDECMIGAPRDRIMIFAD
jgi:ABC-type Fe3+/spermidine/putrescine transport system ATPase subunit